MLARLFRFHLPQPAYRGFACGLVLIWCVLLCSRSASGQSYDELLRENALLKERIRQLEQQLATKTGTVSTEHTDEDHAHRPLGTHGPLHRDPWDETPPERYRYTDPYPPQWWKPADDYRPYSWLPPPSEGFFRDLLFGPVIDTHRNPRGTPWVHPFTMEPAQIHRDVFFIYRFTQHAEGTHVNEHEMEWHLDWGLTRRLGFALGVPFLGLEDPAGHQTGFGDLEFAPRIVWIESDNFFLASNIVFTFPTGNEARGLGRGETTIAPFLTSWHDIGSWRFLPWRNWNQLQFNFGPEVGLESGDTNLLYTVVYAHSLLGPRLLPPHFHHTHNHDMDEHRHDHHENEGIISPVGPAYPVGLVSLLLEFNGQTELQGDHLTLLQLLTGINYVLTENSELRFGVNFPLNQLSRQMDVQYIVAFTWMY